jgi:hypothetical protein
VDVSHFYPIPADEAKLYVGLKPDDRMVLFVGRIEPLKGVDTLIQAMSCLHWKEQWSRSTWPSLAETLCQPARDERGDGAPAKAV